MGQVGTPNAVCSSTPRSSRSQSPPARPISDTLTGSRVRDPSPAGMATTGNPVQSQKCVREISVVVTAGVLVAVAAWGSHDWDRRFQHSRDRVLVEPRRPRRGHVAPAGLDRGIALAGHGALLAHLDPFPLGRSVVLTLAVEAAVVRQHVGGHHVEEVVANVEADVRGRGLDDRRTEGSAGLGRPLAPGRDVGIELD